MGNIQGLEKFCTSNNAIAQEIDIRDEIAKWLREHGDIPTIIIDLTELSKVLVDHQLLHSFTTTLNLGGQFLKFNEIFDYFFGEMKRAGANLVFVTRLKESRYRNLSKIESTTVHPNERLLYNLMQICSKYGQMMVNYGVGERSILAYAREHRNQVMALMTRNARFLVYDTDFSYWCLANVNFYDLRIVEISQNQMLKILALNSKQMQLVFALTELRTKLKLKIVGNQCFKPGRIMEFVKPFEYGEGGFNLNRLAYKLTREERDELEDELNRVFAVNDYAGNWDDDIYDGLILDLASNDQSFKSVLQFCKENIYFAYKLINEKSSMQKDMLCYIEGRQEEDVLFGNLMTIIIMKMCGILFKDVDPRKRPTHRTVQINQHEPIIYPTMELPTLQELLVDEDNKRFENSRWSLFFWLIGLDEISHAKSSDNSKFYRIVLLTLTYLQYNKLISADKANTILDLEMEQNIKAALALPSGSSPPSKLDQRFPNITGAWAVTAHKYTIAFEIICHCLEVCGLRRETAPILFDAIKFDARMQRMEATQLRM